MLGGMKTPQELKRKFGQLWPHLNERARRMVAAEEAVRLGHGGISLVSRACGLSRVTITQAVGELDAAPLPAGRVRRSGAGRRRLAVRDPELLRALEALVEPLARGDPESPLRWTCKSTRALAEELVLQCHPVSHEKVAQFLREQNYSLQGNRRRKKGRTLRIGMRSSGTSTRRCDGPWPSEARSFRSTRRRRRCSETFGIRAAHGVDGNRRCS